MVAVMFMSVALVALLCVLAYNLAVYALPFFVGLAAAQFAYQTGSGLVGAGLVGLFSAGVASDIWRQVFCIAGGGFVGVSAWMRLAGGVGQPAN